RVRLPGNPRDPVAGAVQGARRELPAHVARAALGQGAVLHRQDAEQLPAHRADPPDFAEREDHRRAPAPDGGLLFLLQAVVRPRADLDLRPRVSRILLPRLPAVDGSLGRGPAGPRPPCPVRGDGGRQRADHTRAARVLRPSLRAAGFALLRAGSSRPHAELGAGQAAHLQGRVGAVAPLRTTSRTPQAGARAGAGALPDMRMSDPGGRCGRPSPVTRLRRFLELAGRAGRWTACCGLLAVGGGAFAVDVTRAPYIPDSGSIAVRCGRLIDGLADAPARDRLVIVRFGRIERVTDGGADTAGLPLLDLSRYTCLPGLIDTHTHLTDRANETRDLSVYFSRSDDDSLRISRANAEITLFAGFTSVRNVGAYVG